MRAVNGFALLCIPLFGGSGWAKDPLPMKIEVRRLDLAGVTLDPREAELSRLEKPTVITDVVGLAEAFPDEVSQMALAKQVDFGKEKLLFFQWARSGGDRLTPHVADADEGSVVEFEYKEGVTDDLKRHFNLFAIPREVRWKLIN